MPDTKPPILQIVGYKNSGKTTLLCALVRRFRNEGITVAAIKHDAHDFDFDRPDTDTWKMAEAGAGFVAITSPHRTAWTSNRPAALDELIGLASQDADLVLVEGFKDAPHPKLVLLRGEDDLPLLGLANATAVIIPAGFPFPHAASLPVFGRDDIDGIVAFVRSLLPPFFEQNRK